MKVVLQRSLKAKVEVSNNIVGEIKHGLMVLVGFTTGDTEDDIDYLVNKIVNLRIFDDEFHVMNKSLIDIKGEILSISQFTLYADASKGRRPSYDLALEPKVALGLYELFNNKLKALDINVQTGIFGADMQVSLTNDGPVTIIIESRNNYDQK